jgi:hypothetical protein
MDQILQSYVTRFISDNSFSHLGEATAFEYFTNKVILSRIYPESFDLSMIDVGGGHDNGIDGLAIFVNDHIVSTKEEVDYFREKFFRFDIKFVFIQSKRSKQFESGALSKFLDGVCRFFKKDSTMPHNQKISDFRALKDYIYSFSIDMNDKLPSCEMYYVATGEWLNDKVLESLVQEKKSILLNEKIFNNGNVNFFPVDGEKLKRLYLEENQKVTREIYFEKIQQCRPYKKFTKLI